MLTSSVKFLDHGWLIELPCQIKSTHAEKLIKIMDLNHGCNWDRGKYFLGLYYAGILQGSAFFVNSAQYKAFVGVEKTRLQVCSRSSSLHERGMVGVWHRYVGSPHFKWRLQCISVIRCIYFVQNPLLRCLAKRSLEFILPYHQLYSVEVSHFTKLKHGKL